jgi:hypothetical protein
MSLLGCPFDLDLPFANDNKPGFSFWAILFHQFSGLMRSRFASRAIKNWRQHAGKAGR